jgi:multicomponent Na+:H+ antiporter subunit B
MSTSPIFRSASRFLVALLALVSVFFLLRGHNAPGGGFIGGLILASALAVRGLAYGLADARRLLRVDPLRLAGVGLLVTLASGLVAPLGGAPFLEGRWLGQSVPGIGKVGTVLLFDVGVFLTVVGTALTILFAVWKDSAGSDGTERGGES